MKRSVVAIKTLFTDLAEISASCVGGWAYVIALSGAALKACS